MKRLLSIIIAAMLVLTVFVGMTASAATKNLLTSDEETLTKLVSDAYPPSLAEWDGYQWGSWGMDAGDKPVEDGWVSIDKTTKKYGNASFKIDTKKKLTNVTIIFPIKPGVLTKGSTYTYTGFIKTNNVMGTGGASISVRFVKFPNDTVTGNEFMSEYISGTKDWKKVSVTFKVPSVAYDQIQVQLNVWGPGAGTAWYDGLSLIEGKTAPADYTALDNPKPKASTPTKTPAPTATKTPAPTPDVPSSWAKKEVDEAVAAKLVPAALQSKYTSSITRSDFCDLVVNMIEVKSGKKIADFVKDATGKDLSDKPFPDTASANVNAANKLGIVNGRTNGNFDPSGLITRQEAAKMLALTAKALGADITAAAASFADGAKIADWAKEYVNFVFAKSVMAGTGNNNFSPAANYTREQSILTILRLFKALA